MTKNERQTEFGWTVDLLPRPPSTAEQARDHAVERAGQAAEAEAGLTKLCLPPDPSPASKRSSPPTTSGKPASNPLARREPLARPSRCYAARGSSR